MSQNNKDPSAATVNIWLVEDHDTFRDSLVRLCQPRVGLRCARSFANAEAMLSALREEPPGSHPEVLLLDLGLPGRGGLEAMADVIALSPDCRILILTVFEDETKISTAISAGACGYLLKTEHKDKIVEGIHEASRGGSPMSPLIAASVVKLLAKLTQPATPVSLSPREHEMLVLITEGLTAKEMADRLGVSVHTIDTHTRTLFRKLDVRSRAAAVARAMRDRLV